MAKLIAPGALAIHKTRSGTPIGSPRYMSPEQCRGLHVDHRTDVYAFGCMAYRMLAGAPPFEARTALELMMAHVTVPPPGLATVCTELRPELDQAVLKMLEKDPDHRPQTMLAAYESLAKAAELAGYAPETSVVPVSPLLREMVQAREGMATTALDVSKPRRSPSDSPRPTQRRRSSLAWPAVLGLLAVAALAYVVFGGSGAEAPLSLDSARSSDPPLPESRPLAASAPAVVSGRAPPPEGSEARALPSAPRSAPVRPRADPVRSLGRPKPSGVSRDLEDPY
jgi:serine/threonine protein kinase